MKMTLLRIAAILCAFLLLPLLPSVSAQTLSLPCGTDILHQKALEDPAYQENHEAFEKKILQHYAKMATADGNGAVVTLPVVVHIVHQNGTENISDAQVIQGIQQLNEAFANTGYYDQGTGTNTMIQFCLARRTPDNQPTNGITRDVNSLTNMTLESEDLDLKNVVRWDPKSYINIWLVKEICSAFSGCGVAGYAYFPASHGSLVDGIVMESKWLGSSAGNTGVLVHEMGHYLGLYHTFQGGCANNDCLLDGDRVCDTPPDNSTLWVPCNAVVNTCNTDTQSGFATDQNDMILNFMDYTDFNCFNDFTPDQSDRMNATIVTTRMSLLNSSGCNDPCPTPVTAAFTPLSATIPIGQTLNFTNASLNASAYSWLINGMPFSNAANASYTFPVAGVYVISMVATSANTALCLADSASAIIQVVCPVVADFQASIVNPAPGATVNFTNTSLNATQYEWFVDGVSQGPIFNNYTFINTGVYVIRLEAGNGLCTKTKFVYISVRDSCSNPTFQKTWGDAVNNRGMETTLLADGNYLVAGKTSVPGNGNDIVLIKTDPNGNVIWQKKYGGALDDEVRELEPLPDGGFVISASSGSGNNLYPVVVRFSATGAVLWQKVMAAAIGLNYFTDVGSTKDGNLILAGALHTQVNSGWGAYLAKIDVNNGNVLWAKLYDGSSTEFLHSAVELANGDFILCGAILTFGQNTNSIHDGMLLRTDASGNLLWAEAIGTIENEGFTSVYETADGSIMVLGATSGFNGPAGGTYFDDGWLVKTNANGNFLWSKVYRSDINIDYYPLGIAPTPDDGCVWAANDLGTTGASRPHYFKTNASGVVEWSRVYNGVDQGRIADVVALPDGYLFTGYYVKNGSEDICMLRTDAAGFAGLCPESPHNLMVQDVNPAVVVGQLNTIVPPVLVNANLTVVDITMPGVIHCQPNCLTQEICNNGIDDDGDNLIDCLDPDCDCHSCDGLETNIWYFGQRAGLDFSTDPPTVLTGGMTNTNEAAAVANDPLGRLIFYTDAKTVYQRNHIPMPIGSGLFGHLSSTQTIIVPHPGNPARFYVFTPDSYDNGPSSGLSYSVVDMALNAGFGDVSPGQKNLPLTPANELVEQLSAVRHCNGTDYWVLNHRKTTNAFLAYRIDQTGLNTTPVVSNAGTGGPAPNGNYNVIGQMKISPDGMHLARALFHTNAVELFDFDAATGIVSNPVLLTANGLQSPYGLEFSPTGHYLYTTGLGAPSTLFQFDILAPDPAAILASAVKLAMFQGDYHYGQLQLAHNGKIYCTNSGPGINTTTLGVIHQPDAGGFNCLYQENGQTLAGTPGTNLSLPNFLVSYFWKPAVCFDATLASDTICQLPQVQTFTLKKLPCGIQSVDWQLMGTGTIENQTNETVTVRFDTAGQAILIVHAQALCGVAADTLHITVLTPPAVVLDLGPDRVVCDNGVSVLDAGPGFHQYRWYDGTSEQTNTTSAVPGKYWVDVWDYCGNKQTDTLEIKLLPGSVLSLGPDVAICVGAAKTFQLPTPFTSWHWYPDDYLTCPDCPTVESTAPVNTSYTVVAEGPGGCLSADTLLIEILSDSIVTNVALSTCLGAMVHWNGQDLGPGGPYVFAYTAGNGCDSTVLVTVTELSPITSQAQLIACAGETAEWNGQYLSPGGPYPFILSSINGCDSMVLVTVTELAPITGQAQISACEGETVTWNGQELAPGGQYTVALSAASGCDSTVLVTVTQIDSVLNLVQLRSCPGEAVAWNGQNLLPGAQYPFAYTAVNGCDSTVVVTVSAFPLLTVELPSIVPVKLGAAIQLSPTVQGTPLFEYQWAPATGLDCNTCMEPTVRPFVSTSYTLQVTDHWGCMASDSVWIQVDPACDVYFPNIFHPNEDGKNDWFYPEAAACTEKVHLLRVYTRWGELVFERRDFAPNQENLGWDGRFRNAAVMPGVYTWYAEFELLDGQKMAMKGDITVYR